MEAIKSATHAWSALIGNAAVALSKVVRLLTRGVIARHALVDKLWHQPREGRIQCLGPDGFHQIAYTEWGDPENPSIIVCAHGMTRNSRDFDFLAADLSTKFRVVCMDVVGRGMSDWLVDKGEYGFSLYQSDAAALLARITAPSGAARSAGLGYGERLAPQVDWVGTSMGGLIGMMLAAQRNSPIRRLVLNDVGPMIPWSALMARSGRLSGRTTRFVNGAQVEANLRETCAASGPLTDAQWRHLAGHHSRQAQDGTHVLAFDPAIVEVLASNPQPQFGFGQDYLRGISLWPLWDKVRCPALVLRGAQSDVLLETTAREMQRRHPSTQVVEFRGIGHAPWLGTADQISVVHNFLARPDAPDNTARNDRPIPESPITRSQS